MDYKIKYLKYKNKYITLKNNIGGSSQIKIAVIGEGPVGLVCLLYLIRYKLKYNLDNLEIIFHYKRDKFSRRHIVNISVNTYPKIFCLYDDCEKVIMTSNLSQVTLPILCLEKMFYEQIKKKQVTKIQNDSVINDDILNTYDHVFFADGYNSEHRNKYFYNDVENLKIIFKTPILVLYYNMEKIGSETCNKDNWGKKEILSNDILNSSDLDILKVQSLVSIIYRLYLYGSNFEMPYKNLWIDGFQNYEEFYTIFKTAQTKISELGKDVIIKIWKEKKSSVNAQAEIYLSDLPKFNYDLEKYIDFINSQLVAKKASKRNFILHAVMPNCTSFGIILDDTYKNLYFAKILNDKTSLYLIGDSSAAYPPGYSMEIGMLTIFKFMPIFLKKLFPEKINDDIPIYIDSKLEIGNGILENPDLINEVCNSINTLEFKGGFIKDKDSENTKSKNIKEIIRIINTKEKLKNILIDTYNEIQLNTFILSLIKINCNDIN